MIRKDGIGVAVAVQIPQCHAKALVCIKADITAGETAGPIPQTDAIALRDIRKDGIQVAVAVQIPEPYPDAIERIRADIAAGESAGAIPQTDAIGLGETGITIRKDGIQFAIAVHVPHRHIRAGAGNRSDIAADEAPGRIPQTDAIGLRETGITIRKDGIQFAIAVQIPQRHAKGIVCIRAHNAACEPPGPIPQTDAIGAIKIRKDGVQVAITVYIP